MVAEGLLRGLEGRAWQLDRRNDWTFTWQTVTASLPRSCV